MNNQKYFPIKLQRLYRGGADARCYIVETCIRCDMGIAFTSDDETRFVHPEEVSKGEVTQRNIFAKFPLPDGRKTYSLITWKWNKLARSKEERMHEVKQEEFILE